jgi:hypothetical protein
LQPADAGVGWLARWKCADAKAKQFYGKWLAISDATSYLSLASLASSIVQAGVQSGVDAITFDAIWNARLKGLRPGLSWGARGRLAEEGASEAARLAGLRASMTWVGNASGVASAFATGFSVGARIAFINDCGCEKAGQGK